MNGCDPAPEKPEHLRPWHMWERVFLGLFGASMLLTAYLVWTRRHLNFDDLVTAMLISEPSLPQMLKAIRNGVEVNPPLFFVLQWCGARVWGVSDLALRMFSGASMALAIPVVYATARAAIGPRWSALAVALVFGLSRDVYFFGTDARYYAWLILLTAVAGYYLMRFYLDAPPRSRDYLVVFVTHTAIVYTHLFGLFFSGMLLLSHVLLDYLDRARRWRLYATIIAAWTTFLFWVPTLPQQLSVTKDGTYTPRLNVGMFFEELEMQIPFPVILLLITLLALLRWISLPPSKAPPEQEKPPGTRSLTVLLTLSLAWLAIPIASWAVSHVIQPIFMRRYVAPCVTAWVFIIGAVLAGLYSLPVRQTAAAIRLPSWCHQLAWLATLGFCLLWQPLRAWTEPPREPPFVDFDYGYTELPIVFENPMAVLPRVFYGSDREYVLLLDKRATAASTGYFTKLNYNYFERWRGLFPKLKILYYEELPAWPNGYLAVDDEFGKTLDWLLLNEPAMKASLLGSWGPRNRVYRVEPSPKR